MIATVIHEDTDLPDEASRLLAVSLVGMAQVSARFWLADGAHMTRDDAATLIAGLAWRGIRGYPAHRRRTDDAPLTSGTDERHTPTDTERTSMEVKIGIQHAARELVVETDEGAEAVEKLVTEAVSSEGVLALTDSKGRRVLVPGERIAYIEIGTGTAGHVGFRS